MEIPESRDSESSRLLNATGLNRHDIEHEPSTMSDHSSERSNLLGTSSDDTNLAGEIPRRPKVRWTDEVLERVREPSMLESILNDDVRSSIVRRVTAPHASSAFDIRDIDESGEPRIPDEELPPYVSDSGLRSYYEATSISGLEQDFHHYMQTADLWDGPTFVSHYYWTRSTSVVSVRSVNEDDERSDTTETSSQSATIQMSLVRGERLFRLPRHILRFLTSPAARAYFQEPR